MANSNIETFITTYGSSLPQQQKELLRVAADYFQDGGNLADRLSAALTAKKSASFTQRRKFQQRGGRHFQGRRQAANINQRNIALPALHAAQVAARDTGLQRQCLL